LCRVCSRSGGIFDFDLKVERLEEVSRELENPDIWNDPERAQTLGRERAMLDKLVTSMRELIDGLSEAGELLDLAESENDEDTANAVVADVGKYAERVGKLEFQRMFSGKMDPAPAFVDIQAGAGGTEAQDWAEMLLRMYLRWAESRGWKTELLEVSGGDVAGIKSATFRVEGDYSLRLAQDRDRRASPGAQVAVRFGQPPPHQLHLGIRVARSRRQHRHRDQSGRPQDRRVSLFRCRWPARQQDRIGGAHHARAHGIVVACQTERSAARQPRPRDEDAGGQAVRAGNPEAQRREGRGGGDQVRHRLGQPDPQLRAGSERASRICAPAIERSDTQKVLDGDLDEFVEASLKAGLEAGSKRSDAA
jgi:peptide chain release factor 2